MGRSVPINPVLDVSDVHAPEVASYLFNASAFDYDDHTGSTYVQLASGEVATTLALSGSVNIDLDGNGCAVGITIYSAYRVPVLLTH